MTGTPTRAVLQLLMARDTNALGAGRKITELKVALEHRKRCPLTPYKAEFWNKLLHLHNLHTKYPRLIKLLQKGFDAGIQKIYHTFTHLTDLPWTPMLKSTRKLSTGSYTQAGTLGQCLKVKLRISSATFNPHPYLWFRSLARWTNFSPCITFLTPLTHGPSILHQSHY
jgi:hypothetical protein